jgi:hypothetical protein
LRIRLVKTRYFRLALVAALLLITQAVPDIPATALARGRPPRLPSGGVRPRVGCGGGARVVPRLPSGGSKPVAKLPRVPEIAPKPIPKMPNEPHAPLPSRIGGQRDALNARAAVRDWVPLVVAARARPGELPAVGRHLDALEVNADGLKALAHLRDLVHGPWPQDVRAEDVVAGLTAFENASPQEAPALRRYLALRAEMEGQPGVARQLLRPGEVLNTPSVLRDLKLLEEVSATPPPTSPLVDSPLPEPEPLGLKPPVREALSKGLPKLVEDLPAAELRARRGALRAIEASAGTRWNHVAIALHNLKGVTTDSAPDDREAEVERQLGRPLTPEERLLVRRLLRTKTAAEVVAVLRRMGPK